MSTASFVTPICCGRPQVANMDHILGFGDESRQMVNRVCLRCGAHWYGNDAMAITPFTRAQWDRWVSESERVAA